MSRAFKLYRLQQVDSRLDEAKGRIQAIESILANNTELVLAEKNASEARQKLEELQKELKKAEANTRAQRDKIHEAETKLYSGKVKNPKELQDLQRENASLKKYLAVLEDRQLEAMIRVEEGQQFEQEAESTRDAVRAKRIESHAALRGELTQLQKNIEQMEKEREAALGNIQPDDLELYLTLRSKRRGIAVSIVVEKTCGACGTSLSSSLLQSARSAEQVSHCDTCGRILYAG